MASNRFSIRRGTTAQNDAYTGYAGELTINTDTKTIRVHDGSTVGGTELVTTIFNNFEPANTADFNSQDITNVENLTATNISATNNMSVSGSTQLQATTLHQGAYVYDDLTMLNSPNLYVLGPANATMFSVNGTNGDTYVYGNLSANSNVTITGDLTVNGTTTTINSTTTTLDDPIFTLGGDSAPASDDNKDRGIEFKWHNGTSAKVGFFGFDRSTQKFTFIPDSTNTSEVFSGSTGNVIFSTGEFSNLTSTDLTVTNTIIGSISGNAGTATILANTRTISLSGDVVGSVNFNGSGNADITTTIQPNSVALGTDTTGDYVSSLVAGTGITLSNNSGESATPTITLASSVIASPGTYNSVTVDTYGRVTAGTNPTTLAGYGINDAQPLDATLTALAGVTTSADKVIYATGADTFSTTDLTSYGRTLIGLADATALKTNLSLVIGTDVQAYDATLTALAGVSTSANSLIYATALDTFTTTTLSSFGRSLIDDADAPAARTTLGLGTIATAATSDYVDVTNSQSIAGTKTFTGSIAFSGSGAITLSSTSTATTQTALDNTTKIATTAYVQNATRVSTTTKTANYTLAVADEGYMIIMNSASATTLTVPLNSSVTIPIGAQFIISRLGAGTVNISSSATIYSVSSNKYIASQYGAVTLIKTGTDTWYLFGDLSAS